MTITTIPPPPFPRKGVRFAPPRGKLTAHPPFRGRLCTAGRLRRRKAVLRETPPAPPAPGAGAISHLPRLAGEDGRGCPFFFRASAGGPAEAA